MRLNYVYGGMAHELAHQWLGDYITCNNWADLWINEGGATWSAAMWYLNDNNTQAYYNEMIDSRNRYLGYGGMDLPPIYDLPDDILFIESLTYRKAGILL